MKISEIFDVKNEKDFIKYMKPFGNQVEHIIGSYYSIRKVNMDHDLYEINKYDEDWYKKNSMRIIANRCKPITKEVHSKECVELIIKENRKEKLNKLKECQKYLS